jgi:hypothetical protein
MKMKTALCLLLALVLPGFALAQSGLILPQSSDDLRKLLRNDAGPCEKCGVVTNVRTEARQPESRPSPQPSGGSIGGNIATTPILGSGSVVDDARNAHKSTTYYKMTVRLDDGTYAFFEQDDEPAVHAGERVKIIDGRVERSAD